MLRQILTASALLVPAVALAQSDFQPCENPQYAGTYIMATGELIPPSSTPGVPKATPGVIYNNNRSAGSYGTTYNDSIYYDEGRIPSTSAPEGGVRNSYLVTAFQFAYCTRELDPGLGGLGTEVNVFFYEDYNPCGAPTEPIIASFNLQGLPGSSAAGTLSCWIMDVDLTGFEFCIKADANGVFDNDPDSDDFGFGLQMVNQLGGSGTSWGGWYLAGDKLLSDVGDGTFYQNPGATQGTGLGNEDVFYRVGANGQSTGCFWYGSTGPLAAYWMQLTADLDDSTCVGLDCNGNGIDDLFDVLSGTSLDCNANGIPDECETDCNGNGVPDDCDIAAGTSLDCNANGIPDECEPDCNANGVPDDCDIAAGTSLDCNANGTPDECEPDCNGNGVPDDCDVASGFSLDLDGSGLPDECELGVGTPYCFGVGCPCGNDDPLAGCMNSTGYGALLYSFGGDSVGLNDTELYGIHLPPNMAGLFVMGTSQLGGGLGIPAYDGLACVGGLTRRFPLAFAGPDGTLGLLSPASVFPVDIVPGSTWNFMCWYRNTFGSPCGTKANFTNAVQIAFQP